MKIFKEVDVVVTSEITPLDKNGMRAEGEQTEKTKLTASAFMKLEGEDIALSYLEESEGQKINTDIEITNDTVKVKRQGALESNFVFCEGKSHSSIYKIPPYCFDVEIKTKRIRNEITKDGGVMTIFYDMMLGMDMRSVKMRIEVYIP